MINSVSVTAQTINSGSTIPFLSDRVRSRRCNLCCGGWLTHEAGSGQFVLTNRTCADAIFEVQFNANITSDSTGALAFAIQSDGESVDGTEMDYTVVTANTYQNIGASTLIRVPGGTNKVISVKNLSEIATLVKDANIIVKKVS